MLALGARAIIPNRRLMSTQANLAWTPDRLFYGRVAGRLYTTLLRAGDFGRPGSRPNDVATFLLKDRRGQFLQSVAVELVAAAEGRAAPRSRASSSASAYVGGLFRRASSEALGEPPRARSPSHDLRAAADGPARPSPRGKKGAIWGIVGSHRRRFPTNRDLRGPRGTY